MKSFLAFSTILGLSTIAASAYAAGSPVAFNGTYKLSCQTAELVLHINIGAQTAAGSQSYADDLVIPFDCNGVSPEEMSAFEEETSKKCIEANLPEAYCQTLSEDLAVSISEFNDNALNFIPQSIKFTVQSVYSFWNQVFGIYPMFGQHKFSDGSTSSLTYTLNNNSSSFGIAGVQLLNSGASGQLGCADLAIGGINGTINRTTGALSAQYAIDRSLYCVVVDEVGIIGGSIGLSFRGSVQGQK
jgi:hypothetical protein